MINLNEAMYLSPLFFHDKFGQDSKEKKKIYWRNKLLWKLDSNVCD